MKRYFQLIGLTLALVALSLTAAAQAALTVPAATATANQSAAASLATLPEADTMIYINAARILNEAVPKFMPEKDLANMRKTFEDIKLNAGIDPSKVEYLVIAIRYRKPTADLNFTLPEVMAVAGGDFSAESLLTLARLASSGKLRDEKYGAKTIGLMTIDPIVKQSEKMPLLKSYSEVGIVALNATTIAIGSPGYLKAAIDAGDGNGRITTESLNSLLRDPNALVSAAGSPWSAFAKSFGMRGTEAAARTPRCESQLGDFYVALTMDAANFMLRGAMNADNPDTARIMRNLLSGLLDQAKAIPDPVAQSALRGLALTAEENEVVLRADIPQQMVLDFIKAQTASKQAAVQPATPAKKKTTVRRRRKAAAHTH